MLSRIQSWAKAKAYQKPKLIQSQSWSKFKPKPKVSQSHGYGYWHGCRPPLVIPNYRSELIAAADPLIVNSCLHFPALTEMCLGKTPLLFHGVMGEDVRESESSSYFNPCEAVIVLHYVEQVLAMGMIQKEIGVIAPYRKMVKKLLELFSSKGLEKITIGSTEQLQGLERQVIVLTTVRSSSNSLLPDPGYKSGFLSNPKRFNVAITRARALFIIVGNPFVLQQVNVFVFFYISVAILNIITVTLVFQWVTIFL